jgi:cystathionine beta-lyase/cystathionine gamma-synthase
MSSLRQRIIAANSLTIEVIETLMALQHPKIINIVHPYLKNHKSQRLAEKYFKTGLYPNVMVLVLDKSVRNNIQELNVISLRTSFGFKTSRIDPSSVYKKDENKFIHVRLSIGYEDTWDNIVGAIIQILD